MQGTVELCVQVGYTQEQAELIGKVDDLFEEAVKLDLCSGDEAEAIGKAVGTVMGKHTGKL
jgi:hypothetical protein